MSRPENTWARRKTSGGQAIVMVTLALMAMAGMMGLAVDLGWSFFVKKQAQAAADGAAMAAAQEVYKRVGGKASLITCAGGANNAECNNAPAQCGTFAAASNLSNGCLYAAVNGFTAGGQGGRQNVTIQANMGSIALPPTAPGVTAVAYWVTVRTFQTIPQLFSAVLGNTSGTIAARATAGLAAEVVRGSFVGLNREGDCEENYCGVDIHFDQSGGAITAAGDVILASQCHGSAAGCGTRSGSGASINPGNVFAGMGGNGTSVTAGVGSQVLVLGLGNVQNPNTYHPAPTLNQPDGAAFQDPTKGLTQPPVTAAGGNPNAGIQTCGILRTGSGTSGQAVINGGSGAGLTLGAYNYYSYHVDPVSHLAVADGAQITVTGNVAFSAGGSCPGLLGGGVNQSGAAFPAYLFHGGLQVGADSGNTNTNATFGPGQYTIDGALQNGCPAGCKAFDVVDGRTNGSGNGTTNVYTTGSAGQMLIFTAPQSTAASVTPNYSYPGLNSQISFMSSINGFNSVVQSLYQGKNEVEIKNTGSSFTLNGINKASGALPAQLQDYDGTLTWWDRRNSVTKYNADGSYACPAPYNNCNKTNSQWQADKMFDNYESPEMEIDGTSGHIHFNGVMYQPRGSFIEFQGSSPIAMGVQVISGSMRMEGGASINLTTPTTVFSRVFASLIE